MVKMRGLLTLAATMLACGSIARAASPVPVAKPSPYDAEIMAAKASMMGKPEAALAHAQRAQAQAAAMPPSPARQLGTVESGWLAAEALTRLKHPREALPLLDEALRTVERTAANTKLNGDVLKSRGRAAAALGRVQPALADFQTAFRIYQRANEPRSEALALQEIGRIYSDARDYAHVLSYYAQSSEVFSKDPALNLASHNNRGFALKDLGRVAEAEREFREALASAKEIGSSYLQAQILTNIAFAQAKQGGVAAARATIAQGLALADHDQEAASERPFLLGILAMLDAQAGRTPEAARLLDQTFKGVDLDQSSMDYRDFHEIAAGVYETAGDRGLALQHMKAFKRLDDQGRMLAASTNAALMAAQFDFANQDLKITRLKAGQLERDIALARSKARMHSIVVGFLFLAGGAIFIATLLGFLSMRRSRNRIQAANAQLGVANTALEKALKAKTEFLATTSHEIRTPLNGILGMTQVILADAELKTAVRERLQLVKGAGETMKALVDDLLDVAKAETGAVTLDPTPFDLRRVLAETRGFWGGQAEAKGLALVLDDAQAPRRILADETRLRQVLFNIMSNALKFTEAGGVTLRAAVEDGQLVLEVADTGIGVPEIEHERIFEAFTQVDAGTSRKYAGTGLGLSICRNICQAMQGSVGVRSVEGQGATFTVRLPLTLADAGAGATVVEGEFSAAAVVVLEANPLVQSILRASLAPAVAGVCVVGGLGEALEQLAVSPCDLLLADAAALKLSPGGVEAALHALRAAAPGARLAVTWPSADAEAGEALTGHGADLVILKPIAPADLVARLAAAWRAERRDPALAAAA